MDNQERRLGWSLGWENHRSKTAITLREEYITAPEGEAKILLRRLAWKLEVDLDDL